jgi:hypothetical protein
MMTNEHPQDKCDKCDIHCHVAPETSINTGNTHILPISGATRPVVCGATRHPPLGGVVACRTHNTPVAPIGETGESEPKIHIQEKRKRSIDLCLVLDMTQLVRGGLFDHDQVEAVLRYRVQTLDGISNFDVNLTTNMRNLEHSALTLQFALPGRTPVEQSIDLITTGPNYGGIRFWFLCPTEYSGKHCGNRVGKLYLPLAASEYGCRRCHNLTYRRQPTLSSGLQYSSRTPELFIDGCLAIKIEK